MATLPNVPATVTSRVVTLTGGNLFEVAAQYLDDATQWNRIAAINGLVDPFLFGVTTLKIPQTSLAAGNGGLLGL